MSDTNFVFVLLPGLFICILAFVEIGRRIGMRRRLEETDRERVGLVTVETAIYGLLALIIAFTFSGAASRFDLRRAQTIQEANVIGTAYLRLDLLPVAAQAALREKFRRYTEARIAVYHVLPDITESNVHAARATALQNEIWAGAVDALRNAQPQASLLVLPALNDMIDITTTRGVTSRTHTPPIILGALIVLTLLCSLLVGYALAGGKRFSLLLHMVGFAVMMTVTIYVILDLDHPRAGLIRLDYTDQALIDVLAGMK